MLYQYVSGDTFKKLQEAKNCLTDPKQRKDYDAWLDCGIDIPFTEWRAFRDRCQMVMFLHVCVFFCSEITNIVLFTGQTLHF